MSQQLNSKKTKSLIRAIEFSELEKRALRENVSIEEMKAIAKREKEEKKETEERRRSEKRKRDDDEPTVDPVWNPPKIEGLTRWQSSFNIYRRRELNAKSYGVTKILPLMLIDEIEPRDREEIERRSSDNKTPVIEYYGSKDSTFELEVSSSSSCSPSSSPSSSSSLSSCSSSSSSSNPFAFNLRPKPLSSSSSSSIDSMPQWNSTRADNRYNAKRRHWRRTNLKL